ncbi:hypothetical protein [Aquipseudomonas alcaligenes]|uniref:hypothetical protein n=1 Tax=Aquipseudomonas alcaligenes TaxID=43263 RepID=UPI00366555E0
MSTVTAKQELYLHVQADGSRMLRDCDMSAHADYFGVSIGKVACTITYEDIHDVDPRAVLIGKLEEQITETRAKCEREVNHLLDQISKLQCLEYQPEGAA